MTRDDLERAAMRLNRTTRGRMAMQRVLAWLDSEGGLGLDDQNQEAILTLIAGAYGQFPGTARDIMRDALDGPSGYVAKGGAE